MGPRYAVFFLFYFYFGQVKLVSQMLEVLQNGTQERSLLALLVQKYNY